MYNSNQLKPFVDKVNKEAAEAAQAVFKKHVPELMRRIKPNMQENNPDVNTAFLKLIVNFQNPFKGLGPILNFPDELQEV